MYEQDYDDIMESKMREKRKLIYLYKHLIENYDAKCMGFYEFLEDSIEENWKTITKMAEEYRERKKNGDEKNE